MNIDRRGFLGSLLGSYAASQLPWYARLPEALGEPHERLLETGYRLLLNLHDGMTIRGPVIMQVENRPWDRTISFIAAPIDMQQVLTISGCTLVGPSGKPLVRSNFSGGAVHVEPYDTLKVTQNVTEMSLAMATPEELRRTLDQPLLTPELQREILEAGQPARMAEVPRPRRRIIRSR